MNLGKVQTQQEWSALTPKVIMQKFLTPGGKKTMKTGTDPADIDMSNLAHSFFLRS